MQICHETDPSNRQQTRRKRGLYTTPSKLFKMSQPLPKRASKIKALRNTTAMTTEPPPTSEQPGRVKMRLRFTKDVWNDFHPGTQATTTPSSQAKVIRNGKQKLSDSEPTEHASEASPKRSSPQQKQCKSKVTRFQYGGPDARVAGKHMNDITLEMPCLRSTCASCWDWHAHLMRSPLAIKTGLDKLAATVVEVSTCGRSRPRQRHTVRLIFKTEAGKAKYRTLLVDRTGTDIKRQNARLRHATKQVVRETSSMEKTYLADNVRGRSHKIRLSFTSPKGKESYKRLVERHSR